MGFERKEADRVMNFLTVLFGGGGFKMLHQFRLVVLVGVLAGLVKGGNGDLVTLGNRIVITLFII